LLATHRVETTGQPAAIRLVADRPHLRADGADATAIDVAVVDSAGRIVPDAANELTFRITGAGRILGTGNGDPASHEVEASFESVRLTTVEDWHGRIAPAGTMQPSAPASQAPLSRLGNWLAPRPKEGELYDLSATFTVRADDLQSQLTLFLPAPGAKTSVWLNGHQVGDEVGTARPGLAIPLSAANVTVGRNSVQLLVVPFNDKRNHIPELSRLGALQARTPPPPCRRAAFNGLAQVIVQSAREAGTTTLTASADGMPDATLSLAIEAVPAPPSVP
jgi:beta-galactosidase